MLVCMLVVVIGRASLFQLDDRDGAVDRSVYDVREAADGEIDETLRDLSSLPLSEVQQIQAEWKGPAPARNRSHLRVFVRSHVPARQTNMA
jgi:hypothetical protein